MTDERAHVQALRAPVECGEVLRERLEAPVDPLVEGFLRHALDVLEGADDRVAMLGPRGCDRETAVAHHHARDAVPARRGEVAVPQDLGVVVRVDVEEAGCEHEAVEVDHLGPGVGDEVAGSADGRDAVAAHGDVGVADRRAGPVDECGSAEQEIHRHPG